jgi:hypothetical protein
MSDTLCNLCPCVTAELNICGHLKMSAIHFIIKKAILQLQIH